MLIEINKTNRQLVSDFCSIAGSSLRTFRYFDNRALDAIDKHVITYILLSDINIVGYGHLDLEDGIVWLGICIAEPYLGQGYGKEIMQALISHAIEENIEEINLSVDKLNIPAIMLYNKIGFEIYRNNVKSHFMKLNLGESMADTLGGLIDKLITIDMKMWNNQEFLYEVRRMEFSEFQNKFTSTGEQQSSLFESIKKCCDLNMQRSQLIDEIDEKVIEMTAAASSGENLDDGKYVQRKHKTY
jgi:GNAT superfamily N-acetyltransferase